MVTEISRSLISSKNFKTFMPNSIPMEISLQPDCMTSIRSSVDSSVISHCIEATSIVHSPTVFEYDNTTESSFNGGVISVSSDGNSSKDLPNMLPLDYRLGQLIGNDNLRHDVPQNVSMFKNDKACMEVDSLCGRPNEWEIESICGDSIDTEEDVSSISEWINSDEDFWKC